MRKTVAKTGWVAATVAFSLSLAMAQGNQALLRTLRPKERTEGNALRAHPGLCPVCRTGNRIFPESGFESNVQTVGIHEYSVRRPNPRYGRASLLRRALAECFQVLS
jgi:hypothetical protein